jgi:hypothetical protein
MKLFIFPVRDSRRWSVKNDKGKLSVGNDGIPNYLVKKCVESIEKPLAHICNASLEADIFPDWFNIAKVESLYKHGVRSAMQTY